MRAVIQRVQNAHVTVDTQVTGEIGQGLLVYLGVQVEDTDRDAKLMADKLSHLRIFSDENGKMNRSIQEVSGSLLLVSQFTLCGDCRKGRRPGFDQAAPPPLAEFLYEQVKALLIKQRIPVATGVFRAHMKVSSTNDGPVTFLIDSQKRF